MKFIGAGLIWISFMLMGISVSARYNLRCIIFEEILLMIERITNEICYLMLPLSEILCNIEKDEVCKNLIFLKLFERYISDGTDFPVAWKNSLYKTEMPLKRHELEKLLEMGLSLGHADSHVQRSVLGLYNTYFLACSKSAHMKKEKYSLTAVLTGVLCGGALFILFI